MDIDEPEDTKVFPHPLSQDKQVPHDCISPEAHEIRGQNDFIQPNAVSCGRGRRKRSSPSRKSTAPRAKPSRQKPCSTPPTKPKHKPTAKPKPKSKTTQPAQGRKYGTRSKVS
jgi:hypothetical protein